MSSMNESIAFLDSFHVNTRYMMRVYIPSGWNSCKLYLIFLNQFVTTPRFQENQLETNWIARMSWENAVCEAFVNFSLPHHMNRNVNYLSRSEMVEFISHWKNFSCNKISTNFCEFIKQIFNSFWRITYSHRTCLRLDTSPGHPKIYRWKLSWTAGKGIRN